MSTNAKTSRLYFGWIILAVCICGYVATSPGQTYVVGLFNLELQNAAGVDESGLSSAYMIATVCSALLMSPIGAWSDRFGPRRAMAVFAGGLMIATALVGQVSGYLSLLLVFFLLRCFGQGALGLASGHLVAMWFEKKLSTVEGFKAASMSAAVVTIPFLVTMLIDAAGWKLAYFILGATGAAIVIPLTLFVAKDNPAQLGLPIDGIEHPDPDRPPPPDPAFTLGGALRTFAFYPLVLSSMVNGLIGTALLFHMQPMLGEAGRDPEAASVIIPAWGITSGIIVLTCGPLADRMKPALMIAASQCLLGVATLLMTQLDRPGFGVASMAVFGLSQGVGVLAAGPSIARFYGRKHHGSIRGAVTTVAVAGTAIGPLMLSEAAVLFGGFSQGLLAIAGLVVPLFLLALFIRKPQLPGTVSP